MFEVGEIMEMEEKSKKIKVLSADDCVVISKGLNKNKIILYMKRESDNSEGNVFVRLKEEFQDQFVVSKKLLSCKKVVGMTLNQLKEMSVDEL